MLGRVQEDAMYIADTEWGEKRVGQCLFSHRCSFMGEAKGVLKNTACWHIVHGDAVGGPDGLKHVECWLHRPGQSTDRHRERCMCLRTGICVGVARDPYQH